MLWQMEVLFTELNHCSPGSQWNQSSIHSQLNQSSVHCQSNQGFVHCQLNQISCCCKFGILRGLLKVYFRANWICHVLQNGRKLHTLNRQWSMWTCTCHQQNSMLREASSGNQFWDVIVLLIVVNLKFVISAITLHAFPLPVRSLKEGSISLGHFLWPLWHSTSCQ